MVQVNKLGFAVFGLCLFAGVVRADSVNAAQVVLTTQSIDPASSFLRTSQEVPPPALAIDLGALNIAPGDTLLLEQLGAFRFSDGAAMDIATGMLGLFSSSDVLLDSSLLNRVPGAIDAGLDVDSGTTFFDGLPRDIPQDFLIEAATIVLVPENAAFLFVETGDVFATDNTDPTMIMPYAFPASSPTLQCPSRFRF